MFSKTSKFILIMLLIVVFMIPVVSLADSAETIARASIPSDAVVYNGHSYKLYDIACKWTEAEAKCEKLGGHLVTITSSKEHNFLKKMAGNRLNRYCWIGGYKSGGQWHWITGEPWNYTAWSDGQPNGSGGGDYALMENWEGIDSPWTWDDQNDTGISPSSNWTSAPYYQVTSSYFFICEWENPTVSMPTNVKASQPANNQVKLTWNAGNNAKSYAIYRANGSNGAFVKIGTTKKLEYVDKKVKNGNTYKYKIQVINGNATALSSAVNAYPMDKPKSVKATCDGLGKITVTWNKVTGAKKYLVYEQRPKDVSFARVTTVTTEKAEIKMSGGNGKYKYYIIPAVGSFMGLQSNTASVNATATVYRAVVIGQTYSWNPDITTLSACKNDMNAMKNMLKNLERTKYVEIKTLKNAKKSAILSGIDAVFSKADEDDVTLFYYSGHGHGASDSSNGALIGNDGETITPSELRRKLDQYKGKKVIILDSCHSGAMIGRNQYGLSSKGIAKKINASFIQAFSSHNENRASNYLGGSEYFVITACKGRQLSIAFDKYSLFTACFVDGCGWDEINSERTSLNADRNGDGKLTFKEAFIYSRDESNQIESEYNTAHAAAIAAGTEDPIDVDVQVYPTSSEVFFSR